MKTPFADPIARHLATRFGMSLFLVSLGVLFVATAVGMVVVRIQLGRQGLWPADLPPPPTGLLASTLVIVLSGVTMHRALHHAGARAGAPETAAFRRMMDATIALGLVFLAIQAACWLTWTETVRARWTGSDEWRIALMGFYVLTGLHALHVAGGLIALVATRRAGEPPEEGRLPRRDRTLFCTMYWDFLGVVWLAVYALLALWS